MAILSAEQLEVWHSFLRAHDGLMRLLDRDLREAHEMTVSEYDVLVQLARAPDRRLRMRDLATATLFSPSGLTRACERLERLDLVRREPSPGDQRGTDAVITAAGVSRLGQASATHFEGIRERFVAPQSDAQLAELGKALDRLVARTQ